MLGALIAANDVELYDMQAAPDELDDLSRDKTRYSCLLQEMDTRLNELILKEIGVDRDDELKPLLTWIKGQEKDHVN